MTPTRACILTLLAIIVNSIPETAGQDDCSQCSKYQYCRSDPSLGCGECSNVCESKKADYNWELCKAQCLDYLRDETLHFGTIMEHKDTIEKVYTLMIVSTILLVIIALMVGGTVFLRVYRYTRRKMKKWEDNYKKKLSSVQYTVTNNNVINERGANGQTLTNSRDTMPSTITLTTQQEPSPTYTNTSATRTLPLSTEEPSEDTTLDYATYINQGMSYSQTGMSYAPSRETDLNASPKSRY